MSLQHEFTTIYEQYSKEVYYYLLVLCEDEQLSEELLQETFYQAIQNIHSFKGKSSPYTWLCAIAKNCYCKYIRKNKTYCYTDKIEYFSDERKQEEMQNKKLYQAIEKLKSPYREIVQLHVFDEIPLCEIARRMHKSESFARVAYHRAKNMLKKELKTDEM